MKKQRTSVFFTAAFVLCLFTFSSTFLHAGDFQKALKKFQKAFNGDKTQHKVLAIKEMARTNKDRAFHIIFEGVLRESAKYWQNYGGPPGNQSGPVRGRTGIRKIHEAAAEVFKETDKPNLLQSLFRAAVVSGDRIQIRRWVAAGCDLPGALASTQTPAAVKNILSGVDSVSSEITARDRMLEQIKNNPDKRQQASQLRKQVRVLVRLKERLTGSLKVLKKADAVKTLVQEGLFHTSLERQLASAKAIGFFSDETSKKKIVEKLQKGGHPKVISVLLEAVQKRSIHTAEKPARTYLKGQPKFVRRAAARALGTIAQTRKTVSVLIDRLKEEEGRVAAAIGEALNNLTPMNFGTDHETWKKWWEKNGDSVAIPHKSRKNKSEEKKSVDHEEKTKVTFFGHEINATRVMFVIDISGSMSQPSGVEVEEDGGISTGEGNKKRYPFGKLPKDPTKLQVAKYELAKAIFHLNENQKFNILFYGTQPNIWIRNRLIPATRANQNRAIQFIDKISTAGMTNIYDSLHIALKLGSPENGTAVDQILLLSDGMPNEGTYHNPNVIVKKISDMNRGRNARIDTIVLSSTSSGPGSMSGRNKQFMKELAERNGGSVRDPAQK